MSPEMTAQTGFKNLDADLQTVFDLEKAGRLAAIVRDAANSNLTSEEFSRLVPDGLLRIAFGFSNSEGYARLLPRVHEAARPTLERAKTLVERELKPLLSNHLAKDRFEDLTKPAETLTGLAKELRTIAAIQTLKEWSGSPPTLVPGVRLGFLDRNSRLLLDTTLSWDDLFFLIEGLLEVAFDAMDSGRALFQAGQLDFDENDRRKFRERLNSLEASLNKIREVAPVYGITPQTGDNESTEA
jgi:hypothetical protein